MPDRSDSAVSVAQDALFVWEIAQAEMKTISLTRGMEAAVDDCLFDELNQFKWHALKTGKSAYAARSGPRGGGQSRTYIYMHREVFRLLGEPVPKEIDHRDRNGLNNQRENLRPATPHQQRCNRGRQANNEHGFIGVSWHRKLGKWRARAQAHGKQQHLGVFETALEAALAYDAHIVKEFGEFANLNFPEISR